MNLLDFHSVELGERKLAGVPRLLYYTLGCPPVLPEFYTLLYGVPPSPPPGLSSLTASMDRTTTEISIGLQLYNLYTRLLLSCMALFKGYFCDKTHW